MGRCLRRRGGADFGRNFGRGDEGEVGDDDLVAWADAECAQGEVQGVGAVAAANDVGVELEGGAEFGLEGGHTPADEGGLLSTSFMARSSSGRSRANPSRRPCGWGPKA